MYEPYSNDDRNSLPDPTVFEVIQAANKDVRVLLKEGDVAIDLRRNARICNTCKWPKTANGIVLVPYTIASQYSASEVSLINEALKEFEVMTCVQFVNRNSEPDYLSIESGVGCWSYIGRIFGKQTVSLSRPSCMVYGVIQHEAMHNIGFFHEHTRMDRDNYIDILWQNMDQASYGNFDVADGNTFNIPYDYTSVMHYNNYAYSNDSLPTIVPTPDPYVPIGQRSGMSNLDVMKINANYACNLCRAKLVTFSGSLSGNSTLANQSGVSCLWLIQVPYNKVSLQFSYLNIASTDYVKVYDGYSTSSPVLLDKTYGNGPILSLFSSGRNMLVEFVNAGSSVSSTFTASYVTAFQLLKPEAVKSEHLHSNFIHDLLFDAKELVCCISFVAHSQAIIQITTGGCLVNETIYHVDVGVMSIDKDVEEVDKILPGNETKPSIQTVQPSPPVLVVVVHCCGSKL
ncbi:low choriolytic enzyme-like [Phyllobates terribilis]|uniref:low choriolytic enzyme-like n=1 Tax=Phyllobates terribilis TaxID=111132 RepID=UPI003CCB69E0